MTEVSDRHYLRIGLVAIGRNEGPRLERCLASVKVVPHRVYVDSGSADNSVALARNAGVTVVELPVPPNFTAARARNAGLTRLLKDSPELEFVQVIDGDCELQPGWLEAGLAMLRDDRSLAVVFGRLRERFPQKSIYNALCDDEWNLPVGEASGMLGIALCRVEALRAVEFYDPSIIAGEDSELALRLRKAGWRLERVAAEMALHDAAIYRFGQWWGRTRRSGHCFAELASRYPDCRDPDWSRSLRSIVLWGGALPVILLLCGLLAACLDWRWLLGDLLVVAVCAMQAWKIAKRQARRGLDPRVARASGALLILGKVPQLFGMLAYFKNRLLGRHSRLIEYKGAETV